jgi:hypothetical protein
MKYAILLVFIIGCLALMGCGSAPVTTAAAPTEAPTSAPPPATNTSAPTPTETAIPTNTPPTPFPAGTYKAAKLVHTRELNFLSDGTYRQRAAAIYFSGKYSLDGDKIVFQEDKGSGLCYDLPGTYAWSFDGHVLTLTTVEEKCTGAAFNGRDDIAGQWILQP